MISEETKMKRMLLLLLALLLLGLSACGEPETTGGPSIPTTTQTQTTQPATSAPPATTVPVTVSVRLDACDESCEGEVLLYTEHDCYGQLPVPVRQGYIFLGWYTAAEEGTLVAEDTPLVTGEDHTLYAHWEVQTIFAVTLDPNGGRISDYDARLTCSIDEAYGTLPEPTREGYTFLGWYTEPEGGSQIKSTTKHTQQADAVLYAQWEYDALAYWTFILENRVQQIPQCRRVVVYLERHNISRTYFTSDFLDDAGAINPAVGLESEKVTDEWINSVDPYVIVKLVRDLDAGLVAMIGMVRRFPTEEIYIFPNSVLTAGPRTQLYYRMQLAMILYPEYFEDVDLETVASEMGITPKDIYYE